MSLTTRRSAASISRITTAGSSLQRWYLHLGIVILGKTGCFSGFLARTAVSKPINSELLSLDASKERRSSGFGNSLV